MKTAYVCLLPRDCSEYVPRDLLTDYRQHPLLE